MDLVKESEVLCQYFSVIILVPCMLVASIFVDVGRVYLSKSMAESAARYGASIHL